MVDFPREITVLLPVACCLAEFALLLLVDEENQKMKTHKEFSEAFHKAVANGSSPSEAFTVAEEAMKKEKERKKNLDGGSSGGVW